MASAVVWHFVKHEELPLGLDPRVLLIDRIATLDGRLPAHAGHDLGSVVGMLTARHLEHHVDVVCREADIEARVIATVGLSNALRTGDPAGSARVGTINLLVDVSQPLSDLALIESLALVAEARTAALMEFAVPSVMSGRIASGTGTDCIVVSSPVGHGASLPYAGKHTVVGSVIGRAVELAVREATRAWIAQVSSARRDS